jgi:membrane-bound serine protease (ClpP class)
MISFLLLIIGLVLVLLEFYLPGMVLGIGGGILILFSIIIFGANSQSPLEIFLFILLTGLGLFGVVKFALWQIPRTRKKQSIYLDKDQEGYVASVFDQNAIGKEGIALSVLKPGGFILIEGKKYPAISVSGYIDKGDQVTVISGQGESLLVKKSNVKK